MKLLGRLEKRHFNLYSFYNFFPQYQIRGNTIVPLHYTQLRQDYPTLGAINLGDVTGNVRLFLENLNADNFEATYPKNAYFMEFEDTELEDNVYNSYYAKKLNLQSLINRGERLSERIMPANIPNDQQTVVYKVVTSTTDEILPQTFANGNIFLQESDRIIDGEPVVLHYGERYYGPLTAHHLARDNRAYVQINAAANNYLVSYFLPLPANIFELKKYNINEQHTYATCFIYATGAPLQQDIITDDILLEKLTGDISLDLVHQNPEDFFHRCSNSPFLADLPEQIVQNRMNRVRTLCRAVRHYLNI